VHHRERGGGLVSRKTPATMHHRERGGVSATTTATMHHRERGRYPQPPLQQCTIGKRGGIHNHHCNNAP